jgi:hypothetical protein
MSGGGMAKVLELTQRRPDALSIEPLLTALEVGRILGVRPKRATRDLRDWAVKVINHYSDEKLSDALQRQLTDSIRLGTIHTAPWDDLSNAETLRVWTPVPRRKVKP